MFTETLITRQIGEPIDSTYIIKREVKKKLDVLKEIF